MRVRFPLAIGERRVVGAPFCPQTTLMIPNLSMLRQRGVKLNLFKRDFNSRLLGSRVAQSHPATFSGCDRGCFGYLL